MTAYAVESEAIVNEQLLKKFSIGGGDPTKAIGEEIIIDGLKLTIVGVVQDFHYETVEDNIEPMVFRCMNNTTNGYVNVKISSNDWPATFSVLETAWRKIDQVHKLEAKFYDDQIAQAYSPFSMMLKVVGFLAFLALCISSMGLFGMVVFTTETRLKEMSIRKVLGASEGNLILILSKGFLLLLGIAALIAIPSTYFLFEKVILTNFAFHEPVGIVELMAGAAAVVTIGFLMLGSQTISIARSNPAVVLKNE
jgi:predicted lysophospholipase L1 biosynthesis ABC-type transport system permease subunit